jgi:signal transduction histidine kinase
MNGRRIQVGTGLAGRVAERLEPTIVHEAELDASSNGPVHCAMCVPLINRGDLMGVLVLSETDGRRRFTDHDMRVLGLFAEHAAIAIGNARLFEQERETIARLEELDRLKSDFVATVSHELKTPLTGIIGAAKTLLRKGPELDPEQQASFVEMIERQGNRLYRLVEDILTTAQIESGAPRFQRVEIDLRSLAELVISDLEQTKVGTGRNIELRTTPDHPHVWGDPTAIQQILLNLVENALKYSESTSNIVVIASESRTEVVLEVSDNGEGVSPEELKTIFDRFSQVDSASTRNVGGFGLGLYIVKNLVEAHHGSIEVESATREGSTFRVRLPKRSEGRG